LILRSIILPAQDSEQSGKADLFTGQLPELTIKARPLVWSDAPVSMYVSPVSPEVRKTNTSWLAMSSIPFAAGGVAAHFRTKALHRDYLQSVQTEEAGRLRKEVKQMQLIRNASFGAAGVLGVTGALLYNKKHRNNKRVRMEYLPFACGGSIGITF